jgi:hypothetical protein
MIYCLRPTTGRAATNLIYINPLKTDKWKSKVKGLLRPTFIRPVCLSVKPHLGPKIRFLLLADSCDFFDAGRPLWREDRYVVHNFYWPSPAQSFSGPSPAGLMTIFYCLRFETNQTGGPVSYILIAQRHGGPDTHWVPFSSPPATHSEMIALVMLKLQDLYQKTGIPEGWFTDNIDLHITRKPNIIFLKNVADEALLNSAWNED